MSPIATLKQKIKATPLAVPYIAVVHALGRRRTSQGDEAAVLSRIISAVGDVPKVFVEFGFSGWEFNCIDLARDRSWQGLLLDGDSYNATIARTIFHRGIQARQLWITLETLKVVEDYARDRNLGVLSIDVDGNDYWFLKHLIPLRPAIVAVEINVSMGLRPLTVPYDPTFDRTQKHESWEYYGASLFAMHHLCRQHGYSLVAMSDSGVNAFFVRDDLMVPQLPALSPEQARRPKVYPPIWPDGVAPTEAFWEKIKGMPFVDVTAQAVTSA
jgi:hypothetical protein